MSGKPGRSGRLPEIGIAADTNSVVQFQGRASDAPKPEFLSEDAAALWDRWLPRLLSRGVFSSEDSEMLQSICEIWGLYCASYKAAFRNPTDKDCRIAVTSYWAKFEQGAARFGMNPADRQRLKAQPTKTGVRRWQG